MKKNAGTSAGICSGGNSQSRRLFLFEISSFLLLPSCESKSMRIYLNISLFNYLERPIYDVAMNDTNFMGGAAHGFYGANGIMAMQAITLGEQSVTWKLDGPKGMTGNGELVKAKNRPVLQNIPKNVNWLGLHIYPDDTVEISLSTGTSDELQTKRGKNIIEAWEVKANES
jgi:hypothetical protein